VRAPERIDGYAPIADYALIGDGRTVALVSLDGSVDWLCLPDTDAPPVLAALLDAERGGRFTLRPTAPFEARRRYLDHSNIVETLFSTAKGAVRITEAMTMDGGALLPWTELVRKIECVDGEVELEWRLEARPRWATIEPIASIREGVAVVEWEDDAIAVLSYDAGTAKTDGADLHATFELHETEEAVLAALYFNGEPHATPPRAELELRLERTHRYWQSYTLEIPYDGPWLSAVRRGVLAQRLLTHPPTGAIAAAATTSLPERIGGDRNWDYRFSWVRDTALALESLLAVRLTVECHRSFAWVVDAAMRTAPLVQPMYALDGSPELPRLDIDFEGYRGSKPVRVGNDAQSQLQLGGYGDVIDAAFRYCASGHVLDAGTAACCASIADRVCSIWQEDDSGIWEIDPRPYTQSKMLCWSALDRALQLAGDGKLPDANVSRWQASRGDIHDWVEEHCWSERRGAYVFYAGSEKLDASVLLAARAGYLDASDERYLSTVHAVRDELGEGPFLYRYSGMRGEEGCFLACSFWLIDGLARAGRIDEARALMDELLASASALGLYAEQIDPATGAFLGNFPQTLTHLSLILAAVSVMRAERRALSANG
jgi:GH15 family glucan-1,4-alpha-glucosidase